MARRRLTNDDWGLETNCFVCEARNEAGLRLEFFADEDNGLVEAQFRLGDAYSGAPAVVHGGLSLAVLDEVQAWAVIALASQWAVTVETTARFHAPVWVDKSYRAVGEVTGRDDDRITTVGKIEDLDGVVCVESSAVFQSIGEATAREWAGGELPSDHHHLLRPPELGSTQHDASPARRAPRADGERVDERRLS
jgi:acyl-coenzyme A thioesterase PaaI-like protein